MKILMVIYDNGSKIHAFPQGSAYIAEALVNAGHKVDIYNQDVHHWPDEFLSNYIDLEGPYDIVGLGVIGGYWQYQRLLGLSKAINGACNRPTLFVLGGHGPAAEPEYFLKRTGADVVVRGEGEEAMVELARGVDDLRSTWLADVDGISYLDSDGKICHTKNRCPSQVDDISWPAYQLFPIEYYRLFGVPNASKTDFVMPVASARGCIFNCNFCYRMVPGYRPRDMEDVCDEIEYLMDEYGITYIDFSDELLMSSERRVDEVCSEIEAQPFKFKWRCNGRLNFATPRILKRMKDCGCLFINYGIESFNDEVLERMGKHLTTKQIVSGTEATLAAGISPGLNVIFGNIGETAQNLWNSVEFLLKYADTSQLRTIRPVTPYPGSELFDYAVSNGLLDGVEDFYERRHTNSDLLTVNFTNMSDNEVYQQLAAANSMLLNAHHERIKGSIGKQLSDLYYKRDASFRGFRQT